VSLKHTRLRLCEADVAALAKTHGRTEAERATPQEERRTHARLVGPQAEGDRTQGQGRQRDDEKLDPAYFHPSIRIQEERVIGIDPSPATAAAPESLVIIQL
jgi:hypothetical protein